MVKVIECFNETVVLKLVVAMERPTIGRGCVVGCKLNAMLH